jgi:hypothetical protein
MKPVSARRSKHQRGNALLEAGLIFIVGSVLLFGIFDLAQMLFIHQAVVNQIRAAARWAAVNTYDAGKITNMVLYGTPTAGTPGTELFGMSTSNVSVIHDTSDGLYADRIQISASGYSYLLFSGTIANAVAGGYPSVSRVGLRASMTVPHEHIDLLPD